MFPHPCYMKHNIPLARKRPLARGCADFSLALFPRVNMPKYGDATHISGIAGPPFPVIGEASPYFVRIHAAGGSDEEDVLAVVAARGDVVRHPRNDDSWRSWHNNTLTPAVRGVNAQGTPKAQGSGRRQRGAGRTMGGCPLFAIFARSSASGRCASGSWTTWTIRASTRSTSGVSSGRR